MIIVYQVYLLIGKLFLAAKDSSSYLLKDKQSSGIITKNRIKRWHRDGVILDILFTLPICYIYKDSWWQILISSLILRLCLFDLAFNKWAGLDITFLGSTAFTDKLFVKIFGLNGAIKKSLFFAVLLILLDILKIIFHI